MLPHLNYNLNSTKHLQSHFNIFASMKTKLFLLLTILSVNYSFSQNTPSQWISKGIGGGGAVQNPVISPFDSNRVFMSAAMSEMFETTDFGLNWQQHPYFNLQGGLRGKVCFTNKPMKLYGIALSNGGTYLPKKSTDGGATWAAMIPNPCINFGAFQMYSNLADYKQFTISDKNNIYFTKDSGFSYTTIETDLSVSGLHLAGAFFDGANIYIASNKKIFISNDGGVSFPTVILNSAANISSNEGVVSFTGCKIGNVTKFYCSTISASVLTCQTSGSDVRYFTGLYTMRNPFSAWVPITANLAAVSNTASAEAYYVAAPAADTSTLYIGGRLTSIGAIYGTVFKSRNGGVSFTNTFLDIPAGNNTNISTGWIGTSSASGYIQNWSLNNTTEGFCIDPNNSHRIIRTDKSNVYYSVNGGASWVQMYIKPADENAANAAFPGTVEYAATGLETSVSNWLTWIDSLNLITSLGDLTAAKSSNGGNKWGFNYDATNIFEGGNTNIDDVNMILKHPVTGVLYAAGGETPGYDGTWSDSRLGVSHGRICFSIDHGITWKLLHDFGRPVTGINFDRHHPDSLYACVQDTLGGAIGGIYRCNSVSAGSSSLWTRLNAPARADNRPHTIYVLNDGTLMASYYPYDSTGNLNYAAQSGVFYSSNGGTSWSDRTGAGMTKHTLNIIPDRNDASDSTWFACVGSGGGTAGLYRSTDRGINWANITPGVGTVSCTFNPARSNEMYICSELNGLYYAAGTNSNSFTPTLFANYNFRNPQRVFFNPYNANEVWVCSFGNGLSKGTTSTNIGIANTPFIDKSFAVYPNPSSNDVYIKTALLNYTLTLYNPLGQVVFQKQNAAHINTAGFSSGLYFVTINNKEGQQQTIKLLINH